MLEVELRISLQSACRERAVRVDPAVLARAAGRAGLIRRAEQPTQGPQVDRVAELLTLPGLPDCRAHSTLQVPLSGNGVRCIEKKYLEGNTPKVVRLGDFLNFRDRDIDLLPHLFMHSVAATCMCPDQGSNQEPWHIGMML